jgi:hypothetical protein
MMLRRRGGKVGLRKRKNIEIGKRVRKYSHDRHPENSSSEYEDLYGEDSDLEEIRDSKSSQGGFKSKPRSIFVSVQKKKPRKPISKFEEDKYSSGG